MGCTIETDSNKKPDAIFGLMTKGADTARVLRSMESSMYYHENNVASAKRLVRILWKATFVCNVFCQKSRNCGCGLIEI